MAFTKGEFTTQNHFQPLFVCVPSPEKILILNLFRHHANDDPPLESVDTHISNQQSSPWIGSLQEQALDIYMLVKVYFVIPQKNIYCLRNLC
jgi:hypothetical protein